MRILLLLAVLLLSSCMLRSDWQEVGGSWDLSKGIWTPDPANDTYLVSLETYQDLAISVEFFPDESVNSGVFIRCQDPSEITPLNCLEANIWDNHPRQEFRTGAVVTRAFPPLKQVNTIGRWNRMVVVAEGDRVLVRVNGLLTATYEDPEPMSGHIALQRAATGSVQFRNLKIRPL